MRGCKGGWGRRGSKELVAVRESRREKQDGGVKGLLSESGRLSRGLKKVGVEEW